MIMKPAKQTFKRNISNSAKEKLNKHREMGTDSPFSIIEVAQMLDVVNSKSSKEKYLDGLKIFRATLKALTLFCLSYKS